MAANNSRLSAFQPIDGQGQLLDGKLGYTALGYQQISGPVNATLTPPAGTRRAIIQAEAQSVRWRDDGTSPTTSVGMLISAGGELRYDGAFTAIQFTQTTATAILNVAYYA